VGRSYIKAAKFEERMKQKERARYFYERTIGELGEEALQQSFFIKFAKFEIRMREIERARVLFKYGLEHIPKEKANLLYTNYFNFEKQFGSK
jgi:crooked neck